MKYETYHEAPGLGGYFPKQKKAILHESFRLAKEILR
jgi:hypothetical protein